MRKLIFVLLALCCTALHAERKFFAFDNGMTTIRSVDEQAALLKELGYDGICTRPKNCTDELLAAFDKHGIAQLASYVVLSAGEGKTAVPGGIVDHFKKLKGRETIIWLSLNNKKASLESAAELTRNVCDKAAEYGLNVVFYPHIGALTERIATCKKLMKMADRKNLGLGFTLCHFLAQNDHSGMEEMLKSMGTDLKLVLINGADELDEPKGDWKRLIQPLGKGTLDMKRVFRTLDDIDYKGPVCLQCYKIPGPPRDHLLASMKAWKKYNKE